MKLTISLILVFIATTSLFGQPVFKKMYGVFSVFSFELIEVPEGNKFLLSNHNNVNTDHTFFKIDANGNPFNQQYIYQPIGGSMAGAHRFYFRNDTVYDLIGKHATFGTYPSVIFISRRDSSLQNIIDSRFYEVRSSSPPGIVSCLDYDSTYTLSGGYAIVPGQYYPMMFKLDLGLNLSWSQSYRDRVGYIKEILPATDGGWYLLMHLVNEGLALAKTDNLGNINWCRNYQQPFRYANKMIQLQDGNLLLSGYKNPSGSGSTPVEIFLTKVDTIGQIVWSKTFGDNLNTFYKAGPDPAFYIDTSGNDGIILAGALMQQFHNYTDLVGMLLDSTGSIVWSRCYGNDYFDEFGSICHQTSDGGFILGGYNNYQINNFPPVSNMADVTVIKTDANGVSDGCMEYTVAIYSEPDTPLVTNLTWSIYVDSIVTEIPSNMVDTTGTPTRNENMCTFVSLMEQELLPPKLEVYPNPSNGIFQIKSEEKMLILEVFDMRGSVISNHFFDGAYEHELNLSSEPLGVYLVRLITENDVVVVKVVVK